MAKKIEQPTETIQSLLDNVLEATPSEVLFCGKKRKIGWWYKGTIRKFSHVMATEKDVEKRMVKCCAIILLNHWFLCFFIYPLYWRWLYYIKDINAVEVLRVIDAGKKKIPYEAYSLITILSTGITDLLMTMRKAEVPATQAEQHGVQDTA